MGVFLHSFGGTVPGCVVCRLFEYVRGSVSLNRSSLGGTSIFHVVYSQYTSVVRYRLIRFLHWIVKPILKRSFRNGCSSTCYFSQKKQYSYTNVPAGTALFSLDTVFLHERQRGPKTARVVCMARALRCSDE